ncbi:MAG: DUF1570 domain-containing protein [Planctomycetota bacterium]
MRAQATCSRRAARRHWLAVASASLLVLLLQADGLRLQAQEPATVRWRSGMISLELPAAVMNDASLCRWLDRTVTAISEVLTVEPRPLAIRLFTDRLAYHAHAKRHVLGYTPAMDFCYYPAERRIYGYLTDPERLQPRLRHELVHALVHGSRIDGMPLWLEEGLAELMEGFAFDADGTWRLQQVQQQRLQQVRRALSVGWRPDPDELAALDHEDFYGGHDGASYSAAYGLALLLHHDRGLMKALQGERVLIDQERFRRFIGEPEVWHQGLPDPAPLASAAGRREPTASSWILQIRAIGNH